MSLRHLTRSPSAAAALALAVIVVVLPTLLSAQGNTPKVELFAGYQWLNPGGTVPNGLNQNGNQPSLKLPSMPQGAGVSLAYNFTKHLALEGDYGGNWNKFASENTASIGPKLTFRGEGVDFFLHTLFGWNHLSPKNLDSSDGVGAILGGGMDLKISKSLSFRLFEADYVYAHHNFASSASPVFPDLQRPTLSGARLRTGLVFNFGGAPELFPAAACSIDHNEVLLGEPLHMTVAPSNFNPKHTLKYEWTSSGGKIEGKETGATIDTNGAVPGKYTATARVSDPKKKKGGEASCTSNFTLKPLNPPQLSCSAN